MTSDAHIYIQESTSNLPFIDRIDSEIIKSNKLNLVQKQKPLGPTASIEWVVQSAIAVYLFKPYFESFLSEMGKDHYQVLKKWLNAYQRKNGLFKTNTIASTQSKEKISQSSNINNFFCVYFQLPNETLAKIFMPQSEKEEVNSRALSELLDDLIKIYEKEESKYSGLIKELNPRSYDEIFFIFDSKTESWNIESLDSLIRKNQINLNNY